MCRKGWRLVNGLKVRGDSDIDHVLVGPGGVVVVETKWSAEPWPTGVERHSFMASRLARAVHQARRNASDMAAQLHRVRGNAPVHAVVALWSPEAAVDMTALADAEGVHVVAGPSLGAWFETLDDHHLDAEGTRRIWLALDRQARVRDERDLRRGELRPTLGQLQWRWVWQPALGVVLAVYAMAGIVELSGPLLPSVGMLCVGLGCLAALRRPSLHQAALGSAVAFVMTVGLVVVTLVAG